MKHSRFRWGKGGGGGGGGHKIMGKRERRRKFVDRIPDVYLRFLRS